MYNGGFIMKKTRSIPIGIWLFAVIIILFCLYYYYPLYMGTWENIESILTISGWALFVWFDITLTIIAIIAVTYGFYKAKNLARLYMIFYLLLASFWAIVSIFVMKWQVYEHYLYFVLYVILLMYLNLSHVKDYFGKSSDSYFFQQKNSAYRYGEYTLYTSDVELRSGRIQTIYFFSKKLPEHGVPCSKPDGFTVGVNPKTGMPYLKKKK